ncbi:hypothetical protein [Actinomadura sp. WMMB 499]|uniref:hypothetical protein n=1 Tax=Actinomadura sp. WMMB 499 TaxID=1219491 RepID=UPI0012472D1B|nr:hypothetical protein [Actinomadura sp. WMMB 499]QFG22477.1 hypothetical protein F7P10_16445 [Actinomadura sp. WMMB 499]
MSAVPWSDLLHAYGPATTLPRTLQRAASNDPTVAARALDDLYATVYHQGTVYSATAPAAGVLCDLASAPDVHHRPRILELLSDIACALRDLEAQDEDEHAPDVHADLTRWAHDARAAVAAGLPGLIRLLDDADPSVRAAVPFVLADFPEENPAPLLRVKCAAEEDAGAAASMVLAAGDLGSDLGWLRDRTRDARREVRAAATVALLWRGTDPDDAALRALTDEIQAAHSALDGQLWVLDGGRTTFLTAALDDRPGPQIRLARDALAVPDPAAVHRAGEVMRTWRAAPAELLPPLAELLTGSGEIARDAVWEIKHGGPAIALVADALAPLLDHPDDLIAGSALEALARAGDARAVPALAAELAAPRRAFDPAPALAGAHAHGDALLPALRAFLAEPVKGTGFAGNLLAGVLDGLAGWDERARPLLPEIVSVLERRKAVPSAARALASLGPAAAGAVPALRGFLGRRHGRPASEGAAWAIWRITGDGDEPLRFLRSALRSGLDDDAAENLYALGPAAAPAVPLLEPLLEDPTGASGAAAVVHRATGDTDRLLPHLVDAVAATPAGMLAVRGLGAIGPAAAVAVPAVREIAESPRVLAAGIAADHAYRTVAARALARIVSRGAR